MCDYAEVLMIRVQDTPPLFSPLKLFHFQISAVVGIKIVSFFFSFLSLKNDAMSLRRLMPSWCVMWWAVWRTRSHTLQSFWLPWSVYGLMLGPRSASVVPGNTNWTTPLNSEWIWIKTKEEKYEPKIATTKKPNCLLTLLLCSRLQLPGQPWSNWGSGLPADRAGHLENSSENHWNCWNSFHV